MKYLPASLPLSLFSSLSAPFTKEYFHARMAVSLSRRNYFKSVATGSSCHRTHFELEFNLQKGSQKLEMPIFEIQSPSEVHNSKALDPSTNISLSLSILSRTDLFWRTHNRFLKGDVVHLVSFFFRENCEKFR